MSKTTKANSSVDGSIPNFTLNEKNKEYRSKSNMKFSKLQPDSFFETDDRFDTGYTRFSYLKPQKKYHLSSEKKLSLLGRNGLFEH